MKIFEDFILNQKVEQEIISKFEDVLPSQLISVWRDYGFGSFMNGYLRTINPEEYLDLVNDGYKREDVVSAIPILTTGFGDIIVWQDGKYINFLSFKTNDATIIGAGFDFFFEDLTNSNFVEKKLEYNTYNEAIQHYNVPKYDECFGYVPLLALGGKKSVNNLDIGGLKEHILVILALVGPIVID